MEEVTENLGALLQVSDVPNNTAAAHPRFSQYKSKASAPSQTERRRKLLDLQKKKRYDYVNHVRRLAENDWSLDIRDDGSALMDEEHRLDDGEMDWMVQYCKPPRFYKNQLMLSEWLVEVPNDLEKDWVVVACPQGKRALVVASKGKTIVYTKSGCRVNTFPSHLPGGSRQQQGQSGSYTLLDCIFDLPRRTYHVLDILCWRGHSVIDSETEFRFYWMQTKLQEIPEIRDQTRYNPYTFLALPNFPSTTESLQRLLSTPLPFQAPLDGLLFYHKGSHYLHAVSPLVGWLKAYMVPEVLGIQVPDCYANEKPNNYTCINEHLKEAFDKSRLRKSQMDCDDCATTTSNITTSTTPTTVEMRGSGDDGNSNVVTSDSIGGLHF